MLDGMASHDPPSDEQLAARRDVGALYERYARRLLAFLGGLGVPPRHLDDVHHDVWVRVCKTLEQTPFKGHFRGWLFRIARNLVIDWFRNRRRDAAPLPDPDRLHAAQATALDGLLFQEEQAILRRCLEGLDRQEAAVFKLRAAGASYDEVCETLAMNRSVAYRLSYEATRKLASCVEQASQ
jgi:RNA polymerase sigma-70 factor (ECF subfamily)